jgi:hypothetical protein
MILAERIDGFKDGELNKQEILNADSVCQQKTSVQNGNP